MGGIAGEGNSATPALVEIQLAPAISPLSQRGIMTVTGMDYFVLYTKRVDIAAKTAAGWQFLASGSTARVPKGATAIRLSIYPDKLEPESILEDNRASVCFILQPEQRETMTINAPQIGQGCCQYSQTRIDTMDIEPEYARPGQRSVIYIDTDHISRTDNYMLNCDLVGDASSMLNQISRES